MKNKHVKLSRNMTNHKRILLKKMVLPTGFVTLLHQHELMESIHNFENGNEIYTISFMILSQLCSVQFSSHGGG
jgi:hypothetical protein